MVRINSFFWLAPGRRSILRLSSAFVCIMARPQRSAEGVAGGSLLRLVARCLPLHFCLPCGWMKDSVWRLLLLRLVDACIAETVWMVLTSERISHRTEKRDGPTCMVLHINHSHQRLLFGTLKYRVLLLKCPLSGRWSMAPQLNETR